MWIQDSRGIDQIHSTTEHGAEGVWVMRYGNGSVFTDDLELLQVLGELGESENWWTDADLGAHYSKVLYWHIYPDGKARWLYYMPPDWEPKGGKHDAQ